MYYLFFAQIDKRGVLHHEYSQTQIFPSRHFWCIVNRQLNLCSLNLKVSQRITCKTIDSEFASKDKGMKQVCFFRGRVYRAWHPLPQGKMRG